MSLQQDDAGFNTAVQTQDQKSQTKRTGTYNSNKGESLTSAIDD